MKKWLEAVPDHVVVNNIPPRFKPVPYRCKHDRHWGKCNPCFLEYRMLSRARARAANFRMTLEEFDNLMEEQGEACAKCKISFREVDFVIDHDHSCCPKMRTCGMCTRGIVCGSCNLLLAGYDSYMLKKKEFDDYINNYNTKRSSKTVTM